MGELPHLKALVQRHANQPFAVLGINTDDDRDDYRKKIQESGVNWRSAWQGSTDGPIPKQWGVNSYPTVFVLDADHVIRAVDVRGESLEGFVAKLLKEQEARDGDD